MRERYYCKLNIKKQHNFYSARNNPTAKQKKESNRIDEITTDGLIASLMETTYVSLF